MVESTSAHTDTFVIDRLPSPDQWPQILDGHPDYQYPARLNAAVALLDEAIERGWGRRPCVSGSGFAWTYDELGELSNRIANLLVDEYNIEPGNRVLLRGPNTPWMVAAWFAVLKVGAVAVATMPLLRAGELKKIQAKSQTSLVLCDEGLREELELADLDLPVVYWGGPDSDVWKSLIERSDQFDAVDTAADDPALLGFTSGTTGTPKAAVHFHRDLLIIADSFQPILKAQADDIFCGSPPLAFTFGLGGLVVFPMRVGASTVLCDKPGIEVLTDAIARNKATVCFTAPTAYRAMLEVDGCDLSSLRRCVSAGETLPVATYEAFRVATGLKLIDGLGSTELLHIFIASADDGIKPGATGKPLPGWEARIVDDDGNPVADGTVGQLAVRGPIGCRYLDDERQSEYVRDGWNFTGDAYIRDADGFFAYQARTDDMIITAGYNVAAPEVEQALLSHPSVAEAGVIGVADDKRGTVVKAYVSLRDPSAASDAHAAALKDHVKATIAPYKYPRLVEFVDGPLPKTQTGKLRRQALREI